MITLEAPLQPPLQAPHFLGNDELKALCGVIEGVGLDSLGSVLVTPRGERQQLGLHNSGLQPGTWNRVRRFGLIHPGPTDPAITAVVSIWNGAPSPYRRRDLGLPEDDRSEALRRAEDTGVEVAIIRDGTKRHAILDVKTGEASYCESDATSGETIRQGTAADAYSLAAEAFAEYFDLPLAVGTIATESAI